MAIIRTLPLDERIDNLRADLDAWIDARVAEEMKRCPGVPAGVIRQTMTRGLGCQCAAYLEIKRADDEATARETAA
jgi:hypothetical protein